MPPFLGQAVGLRVVFGIRFALGFPLALVFPHEKGGSYVGCNIWSTKCLLRLLLPILLQRSLLLILPLPSSFSSANQ